jgi:diguanylate cyclase (GGDEF)-like protein/PAS domain S-box-containing protein
VIHANAKPSTPPAEALLDILPLGVIAYDAAGSCTWVNPAAAQLLGEPHELLFGQSFRQTSFWQQARLLGPAAKTLESGRPYRAEVSLTSTDGKELVLDVRLQRTEKDGRFGLLLVFADLTERRRAEDALRLTQLSLDKAADLIHWIAPDGRILYANDSNCHRHGYGRKEMLSLTIFDLDPALTPARWRQRWAKLMAGGSHSFETQHRTREGSLFPLEVTATYVEQDGQEFDFAFARDISERKALERSLRLAQHSVDKAADAVIWTGQKAEILYANEAACRRFGYTRKELLRLSIYDVDPGAPRPWQEHWQRIRKAGTWTVESQNRTKDGELFPVEVRTAFAEFEGSKYNIAFVRDISERKRAEELLQETLGALERSRQELFVLASHDSLTGLLNRRSFEEEFCRQLAEQQRLHRGGALLWLDLDHFKEVNDTLGHHVGDELLAHVAETLRKESRRYSVIARLGGDEFAILIPAAGAHEAVGVANRLLRVLEHKAFVIAGHTIPVGASIGIALYPQHGRSVHELLSAADVAMYHAKESGRARMNLYDARQPWVSESTSRNLWGERIRAALAQNRLVLYAQPICGLAHETGHSYELLLRMRGEDGQLIAPLEFIPAAERLGLIGEIDAWVVREAIRLLAAEQAAGAETHLAINLSGRTLSDTRILEVFRAEFAATGADPQRLTVEITETAVVSNIAHASELVRELHRLGCRFSMDDFGSGASSFYYLRHLPVDVLKIDGSLIRGLGSEPTDEQFVRAIVQMCEALQIASVAEYVESEAALAQVRAAGVSYAQGFSLGRPEPLGTYLRSQASAG